MVLDLRLLWPPVRLEFHTLLALSQLNLLQLLVLDLRFTAADLTSFLLHLLLALIGWTTLSGLKKIPLVILLLSPASQLALLRADTILLRIGIENAFLVFLSTHWSGFAGYCAEEWIIENGLFFAKIGFLILVCAHDMRRTLSHAVLFTISLIYSPQLSGVRGRDA